MRRRTLLAALPAVAIAAGAGVAARHVGDMQRLDAGSLLTTPQVWAHMVPHGLPDFLITSNPYGTDRPLDLVNGGWGTPPRATGGVARALASGVTGMQILQFESVNKGSDFVVDWFDMADPTWATGGRQFLVAPCIMPSSRAGFVRMVQEYWAVAKGRVSSAKENGRPVIYVYSAKNLSASEWAQARGDLVAVGINPVIVASLGIDASQHDFTVTAESLDFFTGSQIDAYWLFDDSTSRFWDKLLPMLSDRGMHFCGGIQPGYDRETDSYGGYVSPRGTRQFREQWQQHLDAGLSWVNIVTWNDAVERTDIKAGSDWSITRQDINAFYSARLRGVALPKPRAELYATSSDYVRLGESVQAEALVLNGSTESVKLTVRLVDGSNQQLGQTLTRTVAAGEAADLTTPSTHVITTMPAGRHIKVEAWTHDTAGKLLQHVVGAPVLVYTADEQPTPMMRKHFYSVPAQKVLGATVFAKLSASPLSGPAAARLRITTSTGLLARSMEVIQNTRPAGTVLEVHTASIPAPMGKRTIIGGEVVSASPRGFYLARVIDEQERVGYSAPLYIP